MAEFIGIRAEANVRGSLANAVTQLVPQAVQYSSESHGGKDAYVLTVAGGDLLAACQQIARKDAYVLTVAGRVKIAP